MAISASSIAPTNSLEDFRIEFNNLVSDVTVNATHTNTFSTSIVFEGATADNYETTLTVTDPTADRTVTLPNVTGTVSLITATETLTNKSLTDSVIVNTMTHADDVVSKWGTGNDFTITHDGSNTYLDETGTGSLYIRATDFYVRNYSTNEEHITAAANGAVNLFYDNSKKFETSSAGGTLTGTWNVTTSLVPDAADGATLGSASLEWSDIYLADGGIIYFGVDQDVKLTHLPDSGLQLKHTGTSDNKPIQLTIQTGETDIQADDVLGQIAFQAPDEGTGSDAILVAAAIQARSEGDFSASSNATTLDFMTAASDSATATMTLSSVGNLDVVGDVTGATLNADGDTASGDNAAIGYTAAEGLILTGQGSTNDVTIKNDADADVITIATGGTAVDVVGALTAATVTSDAGVAGTTGIFSSDVTGLTVNATGDTATGDNAAIGYTAGEGLILTGQGSTNDVTIKNDADADVITIATGGTAVDVVGALTAATVTSDAGVAGTTGTFSSDVTGLTLNATGDTATSDNAAIGYTSAEGLILTGQGSTNDVTIKNDADGDVISIPTGTTNVTIAGDLTISGDDLYMGTNTSGAALIADGTNYNPVVISGDATIATNGALTIASTSVEGSMLNNNVISGLTALTSGLATTDELMVSDAGTLKRMDVSVIADLVAGDATALAIALG